MSKEISARGKRNRLIATLTVILIITSFFLKLKVKAFRVEASLRQENTTLLTKNTALKNQVKRKQTIVKKNARVKLNVPLIDQLEEPSLYNGCEVSSLAMLLQYNGLAVSKTELAAKLPRVPLKNEEGLNGNPEEAFVGSLSGKNGTGYSVYSQPVIKLAKQFVTKQYQVYDLTGKDFDAVLTELLHGNPVWVITTVPFKATNDMETWQTTSGDVDISWNVHSVALTGMVQRRC